MFKLSKLFSFQRVLETFKRFPLPIFVSALASGIMIYLIVSESYEANDLMRVFISLVLTFPLFVSSSLFGKYKNLIDILIAAFGFFYFYINNDIHDTQNVLRDMFLALAFGATILFAPYLAKKEQNGYWQYIKELFITIVLTAVSSGIILGSLELAVFSIQNLFELEFSDDIYQVLVILVNIFYASIFFLSLVPSDFKKLEKDKLYPAMVEKASNFIFVPILGVYFLILTAYVLRILITQTWPNGWVAAPILLFTILGILTYALLSPFRKKYHKCFFYAVPVFLIVYFIAFYQRIDQYGLTEMRYFGVLAGVYLLGISIYFLVTKKEHLKVIPMTLSVLAILSVFGPWSAFNLSINNQFNRLEKLLTENSILVDGKIQKIDSIDGDLDTRITASINFFADRSFEKIMPWFSEEVQTKVLEDTNNSYNSTQVILEAIGIDNSYVNSYVSFQADPLQVYEFSSYDYYFEYEAYVSFKGELNEERAEEEFMLGEESVFVSFDEAILSLRLNDSESLKFDMSEKVSELIETSETDEKGFTDLKNMSMTAENSSMRVKLYLNRISDYAETERDSVTFSAKVLLQIK